MKSLPLITRHRCTGRQLRDADSLRDRRHPGGPGALPDLPAAAAPAVAQRHADRRAAATADHRRSAPVALLSSRSAAPSAPSAGPHVGAQLQSVPAGAAEPAERERRGRGGGGDRSGLRPRDQQPGQCVTPPKRRALRTVASPRRAIRCCCCRTPRQEPAWSRRWESVRHCSYTRASRRNDVSAIFHATYTRIYIRM